MPKPKRKSGRRNSRSNATKHGGFAREHVLLPGERKADFDALCESLIDELRPQGTFEIDTVLMIAKLIWAEQRAGQRYSEEIAGAIEPEINEEIAYVETIIGFLLKAKDIADADKIILDLPAHYLADIKADLSDKPINELGDYVSFIIQRLRLYLSISKYGSDRSASTPRPRAKIADRTNEIATKYLALTDRLNSMIDRTFRRLLQVKAYKDLLAQRTAPREIESADRQENSNKT